MTAYYNEIDPYAAQWLRNLIAENLIAEGEVDERSITEVQPGDLAGFNQCHFFAGIGGWSLALRLAGWPDTRPVWTGSCPCQPFSESGARNGFQDSRHLWPELFRLIKQCQPVTIFGEQVAKGTGLAWLDCVQTDLESEAYTLGAVDLCAAGIGSPHARQRLYWVSHPTRRKTWNPDPAGSGEQPEKQQKKNPAQAGRPASAGSRGIRLSEPGVRKVVNGFPGIVEQNSAYGNAIHCGLAAEFIKSVEGELCI